MDEALGQGPFDLLVDLGTGTGRMLELFAPRAARALGFDLSHDMLAYARMKLERAGLAHAQVRHADLYNVPLPDGAADAVVLHQVLHFLDDPGRCDRRGRAPARSRAASCSWSISRRTSSSSCASNRRIAGSASRAISSSAGLQGAAASSSSASAS